MDLNHARLPIPPRWPGYYSGRFRHFGRSGTDAATTRPLQERTAFLFYRRIDLCQTQRAASQLAPRQRCNSQRRLPVKPEAESLTCSYPSSFAVIVIFAFSTFDTGHPLFASSAALLNAAASAVGTRAETSRCTAVIAHPESSFSIVKVAVVEMLSAVSLAPPSCPESAMEKQAACAAAINSSGFVPGVFSNLVANE